MPRRLPALAMLVLIAAPAAAGEKLYGVHWWDYSNPAVGAGPDGGWAVETVVTHSAPWWQAAWFAPLYQEIDQQRGASILTRVDYDWGQTIPAPTNPDASAWPSHVASQVVGVLGDHSRRWIIGNEPNIVGEGNGWANSEVTPQGYAAVYHQVRQAIHSVRPQDEVLFAPVSPGGVIPGVRWESGAAWLGEAIDAVHALPGGEIDGFAVHAYGNPFVGADQAALEFLFDYSSQLALIDGRGYAHAPVYLTEWSRSTATTGDLAANEAVSAEFLRQAMAGLHAWNQGLGNHNIAGTAWFVYNQDYGGWEDQSLEWWRSRGAPEGTPGDLWTAMLETSAYPAGLVGTRPFGDFDRDGDSDTDDHTQWVTEFGATGPGLLSDPNRDLRVDAADYTLWRDSLSGSAADALPEPASTLLAVAGCAIAYTHRGRRVDR